jgi:hypothetical protein
MPTPTNNEFKTYSNYAAHCLQMVTVTKEEEARSIWRRNGYDWRKIFWTHENARSTKWGLKSGRASVADAQLAYPSCDPPPRPASPGEQFPAKPP